MDMIFKTAWDDFERASEKVAINKNKHGIAFPDASVFREQKCLEISDLAHSDLCEDRFNTIGRMEKGIIAMVVTVERSGRLLIISVRIATQYEEKLYYGRHWLGTPEKHDR